MKKTAILTLAALLAASLSAVPGTAAEDALSADITVNLANGELILAGEQITVTDTDSDGALTIGDALICLHDAKYEGGAAAGYATAEGQFGAMITKLWGVENGGSYSYFLNNAFVMGLTDPVKTGDTLYAYIITDLTDFSDTYTYFDRTTVSCSEGDSVSLTLSKVGYDENWNAVALPVADATITVDGKATGFKTDAEGKVTVKLDDAGRHVISIAPVEGSVLVPPVSVANVDPAKPAPDGPAPSTGDLTVTIALFGLLAAAGTAWICRKSRHEA